MERAVLLITRRLFQTITNAVKIVAIQQGFVKLKGRVKTLHTPASKTRLSPLVALALGILIASTSSILVRLAQQGAPSLVIAALRLTFATLLLAPFAISRGRAEFAAITRRDGLALLAAGFFLACHFGTWITSLELTSVASSAVLVQTTPFWVALLSILFLREIPRRRLVIGLAVALTGGVLVSVSTACQITFSGLACSFGQQFFQGRAMLGNLLALAGAMFFSAYLVIGRRIGGRLTLLTYIFLVYGAAAGFLLLAVAASGQSLLGYPGLSYVWTLALAVGPQLTAHTIYNWVLRYIPAAFVSVTLLSEPVGSTLLAFLLLNQTPSVIELAGGALILTGIVIASRERAST